jgi:hypothetical protein
MLEGVIVGPVAPAKALARCLTYFQCKCGLAPQIAALRHLTHGCCAEKNGLNMPLSPVVIE